MSRARLSVALEKADRIVPIVAILTAGALYAVSHHRSPLRPTTLLSGGPAGAGSTATGWFTWFDASRYLRAAVAWTHFDLRPASHWYPPGYPIAGAIGYAFTPIQPFYLPDGLALIVSCWLFALIAAEVLDRQPGSRALGALVFLATTALVPAALFVWLAPWSTTPATPAIYGCLLAGLRFMRHPRARSCFLAGLSGAGVMLFRPTESVIVLATTGVSMLSAMLRKHLPIRRIALISMAGTAGVLFPAVVFIVAESATGGFAPGGYIALSQHFGFEPRLIWLHWIEIIGDPRPLWPGEHGLLAAFPWIVPGAVAIVIVPWRAEAPTRAPHLLLAGTAVFHSLLFLAYRDMEPSQIWWIYLYHYFKWVLPVLGLYAALLPALLIGRGWWLTAPIAIAVAIALFGWRAELRPMPGATAIRLDQHRLRLPRGLGSMHDALAVPAIADFDAIFHGPQTLTVAGKQFKSPFSIRAFPRAGGLLLLPLRPMPAGDTVVTLNNAFTIEPDGKPFVARQVAIFGVPCWIWPSRAICYPPPLFSGPVLAAGQVVRFDRPNPFEGEGWAKPEAVGSWTLGHLAVLNFRIRPSGGTAILEFSGSGFAPGGGQTSPVKITINGQTLRVLQPPPATGTFSVPVPKECLGPNGHVLLEFDVEDPRRPIAYGGSGDPRRLGLLLRSMRLLAAGSPA